MPTPEGTPSSTGADLVSESLSKRRSTRACDQCRRTKSKCRKPSDSDKPCSNCVVAGLKCTYEGPSFKRGPPKGYITAIEQRLHQVEALLGAIIVSTDARSRGIISDLKTDPIAHEIIVRVEKGPYGTTARSEASKSKPADFSAVIRELRESQDARAGRDSRVNRENMSSSLGEIPTPTFGWLKRLEDILEGNVRLPGLSGASASNAFPRLDTTSVRIRSKEKEEPYSARTSMGSEYTENENEGDVMERIEEDEAIGRLSMDENNEIRYHHESSGMELLDKLTENASSRNTGGIWNLPMARTWPFAEKRLANLSDDSDAQIAWPDVEHQRLLIELYFTYAHPDIPVIHKPSFLAMCDGRTQPQNSSKLQQKLFQLLLLSIFTVASRFNEKEMPKPGPGKMWEAGCDYLGSARSILNTVLHMSSLTTCQSLIILAYREFGLGSFEQSSFFIGIAIRMAQDLGLHRTADRWQRFRKDVFSGEQKQERKHIWWACNIEEKHIACSLGSPISIRESDYDTELPDTQTYDQAPVPEDIEFWTPHPIVQESAMSQTLSYTLSVFRASATLSEITGRIIGDIYAVRHKSSPKTIALKEYDMQLMDWARSLPNHLRLNPSDLRSTGPNVFRLHIQHAAVVILLHRKFIPKMNLRGGPLVEVHGVDSAREFVNCQEAAFKVTELVLAIRALYTLKACSAHLPSCLLSAGIMHVASLARQHGDLDKISTSLKDTLTCLKEMEHVWPSALKWYELLYAAYSRFKMRVDKEPKRVDECLSEATFISEHQTKRHEDKEIQSRIMERILGLEFPGTHSGHPMPGLPTTVNTSSQGTYVLHPGDGISEAPFSPEVLQWIQSYPEPSIPIHGYDFQSFI